tara:strand:- start:230 stop:673 length:444 start_codon:yes stop_codon:yes gene_type:complete
MEVRWASPFEISAIVALLVVMHEEAEENLTPVNTHKTFSQVNEIIHQGICLVAFDGGKIVGTIGGKQVKDWWSDQTHVGDYWFYVAKDKRASKAALLLVKEFMKISKKIFPKDKIRLAHVFSGDCSRKDNFFERLGFKKAGTVFLEV